MQAALVARFGSRVCPPTACSCTPCRCLPTPPPTPQLDAHPRAPQLFTALLQQAGVAPELLPLLAEPARGAVGGLGILARRQQPQHVLAFLQALLPMAAAAGAVARQALAEMRAAAAAVRERWEARQRELQEQEAAALAAAGGDAAAASQAEVRAFFARQQRRRAAREQPGVPLEAAEGHPQDELELGELGRAVGEGRQPGWDAGKAAGAWRGPLLVLQPHCCPSHSPSLLAKQRRLSARSRCRRRSESTLHCCAATRTPRAAWPKPWPMLPRRCSWHKASRWRCSLSVWFPKPCGRWQPPPRQWSWMETRLGVG